MSSSFSLFFPTITRSRTDHKHKTGERVYHFGRYQVANSSAVGRCQIFIDLKRRRIGMVFSSYMYIAELGLLNRRTWSRVYVQLDETHIYITRAPLKKTKKTWWLCWSRQHSHRYLIPVTRLKTITAIDMNEWCLHYNEDDWIDLRCDHAAEWIWRLRILYALHCKGHVTSKKSDDLHSESSSSSAFKNISRRSSEVARYWQKFQDYD